LRITPQGPPNRVRCSTYNGWGPTDTIKQSLQIKLESFRSCHCYLVVLLARTAANTYGTNNLPIPFKRNTTRKDHDPTIIGGVNAKKLPAALGLCCQILRGNVESSCRKGFLNRDINTTDPGFIHTDMSNQVPSRIGHRYIHRLTNFLSLFLGSINNSSCILKRDHQNLLLSLLRQTISINTL
jgi:hypothetical protein